ncbi:MAG: T9SS type A sorting domain-containing protein [Flavobacteriales bacterium]
MKKIYLLAVASVVAMASFGQKQQAVSDQKATPRPVLVQDGDGHPVTVSTTRGSGGSTFWCEDFSNGLAGSNGVGAMTIQDSGTDPIWMMADANSPAGQFSSNLAAMASPTAANGWVVFDCDLYNDDLANVETVSGTLTTPSLDMTSLSSVIVDYYQYFRYCCFSASPLTLEVSVDGGTNWTVFPGHGTFIPSANTLSANPLNTTVDISCVAAGESNVRIRWGYNTAIADGYSHYFWGIDDICIYENESDNDLEIVQVTNGDVFNLWEYRVTPMEQKVAAGDGGVFSQIIYRNKGYQDQTNTVVTLEVIGLDGTTVLTTVQSAPFTAPSTTNDVDCPAAPYDTLALFTNWEPAAGATGVYILRATISSDATDLTPENNTYDHDIEYTDYEYGHDALDSLNIQVGPADADTPGNFQPCGFGNFFTFPNAGSTAYGLTTLFGSNCNADVFMQALLVEIEAGGNLNDNGAEVGYNEFETLNQTWIDADYPQYFPFEDAVDIDETLVYFCGVRNPDESSEELWVLCWDDSDTDNSTGSFEQTGDGDFVWFGSQTFTPYVRLILENRTSVEELAQQVGLSNFLISPNPAVNMANVNFTLAKARYVAYEVRSIDGKLIEWANLGMYNQGNNTLPLDVTEYAAGNYIVNIIIDGEHIFTQQMSVTK